MRLATAVLALSALGSASWAQIPLDDQILVPAEAGGSDNFGAAIDIDGDRMIVGGRGLGGNLFGGPIEPLPQAWLYERDADGLWSQAAVFDPPGPYHQPTLFRDVAIDGDYAFVKRTWGDDLHIYERDALGSWNLVQTIGETGTNWADSIEAQDGTLLVGVPGGASPSWNRIEVYERQVDGEYALTQTIPTPQGMFGFGEKLVLDGDRAFATAKATTFGTLRMYELERVGGTWQNLGLIPSVGGAGQIALDGDRLANAGDLSVRLFQRQTDGSWELEVELAPDISLVTSDDFGTSVDLNGDWLAVGAATMREDGGDGLFAPFVGGVYLFRRDSAGEWGLVTRLAASDPDEASGTGIGIALGDDVVAFGGGSFPDEGSVAVAELGDLFHGERVVSTAAGGEQELYLFTDASFAGQSYLFLGSASGVSPGIPVPGTSLVLPVALDFYTLFGLTNGLPVSPMLGVLDSDGNASSTFRLPAGAALSAAGLTLHHAFLTFDALSFTGASNAVSVELVP